MALGIAASNPDQHKIQTDFSFACFSFISLNVISVCLWTQVANYGVGGQYEPHFDFGRKDEPDVFEELGTGNRIATWLLYMSDVQAGGATVFTDVGASVRPKKVQFTLVLQLHQASDRVKISN
ncbi:prolyl 4-hydroxylase subunit alpha-1-like [Micropterus salmoides]|uniref:prolyl 4-hydroxylase subunit alpha-1-like n=1 Tax=Micropterus salmoides TaxID=27706 RepID=UPI0018EE25D6|nr:prolyl 4-hydroxylase subunit alpha-1-like [Micropterus salmoides]